ncbi:MAG: hypothetical protein ACHQF0_15770 [Chitinophagales bacterium]
MQRSRMVPAVQFGPSCKMNFVHQRNNGSGGQSNGSFGCHHTMGITVFFTLVTLPVEFDIVRKT